ncbi:acyl-CoA synthetase [Brevibacillus laterosporus]|uniref:acyl-CoA synthetase n=1 Tax=Brevibacillus laterosporus TaxID=1465 RepID=UPI000EB09B89|nr:AMP-binding protein [Brevibacillus laterosporus]AYK08507.1 acyl--CoA ligase [Brevibacillus laterosporus]
MSTDKLREHGMVEIPLLYNFASEVERYALLHPEKAALVIVSEDEKEEILTYEQLRIYMNKLVNAFLSCGIACYDKVLVLVPRGIEAYGIYLALIKMGAVVIPGSEMLRGKDIAYRANHAEAKAIIATKELLSEIDDIREECESLTRFISVGEHRKGWQELTDILVGVAEEAESVETGSDELAFLSYTSGTTGGPKGVMHVHGWPFAHLAVAATYWLDVQENDLVWATASPGWAKWIWSPFVSTLGKGATAFVYKGKFRPDTYLSLLQKYPISVMCATPTEYRLIAKMPDLANYKMNALRSACSAGEPLNREVIDTFRRTFNLTVRDGYGQTENTLLVGTFIGMEPRPGSMGRPSPAVRIAIIDEEGNELETGKVGDIAVDRKMIALCKGYLNDSIRTQRAFRGDWYVTGDQGRQDEDGYIWFEGRSDDIIISSGYTIGPFEVEDALVKHEAVAECAAVASPDPDRGQVVKAFIVLKQGVEASDELITQLQEHVKSLTAPYKYPRKIQFVSELPKTTSGKIRRLELRQNERSSERTN